MLRSGCLPTSAWVVTNSYYTYARGFEITTNFDNQLQNLCCILVKYVARFVYTTSSPGTLARCFICSCQASFVAVFDHSSLWASQKVLSPHPQKGLFCLFWTNAAMLQNKISKVTLLSIHAKFHALRRSRISPELLFSTRNWHIVNDWTVSHDKWEWSIVKPYKSTPVDLCLSTDSSVYPCHEKAISMFVAVEFNFSWLGEGKLIWINWNPNPRVLLHEDLYL